MTCTFKSAAIPLYIALAALMDVGCGRTLDAEEFRIWTDVTGKYKKDAKLIEVKNGIVSLQLKKDGTTKSIPLEKLSKADRDYLATIDETPIATPTSETPKYLDVLKNVQNFKGQKVSWVGKQFTFQIITTKEGVKETSYIYLWQTNDGQFLADYPFVLTGDIIFTPAAKKADNTAGDNGIRFVIGTIIREEEIFLSDERKIEAPMLVDVTIDVVATASTSKALMEMYYTVEKSGKQFTIVIHNSPLGKYENPVPDLNGIYISNTNDEKHQISVLAFQGEVEQVKWNGTEVPQKKDRTK